MTLSKLAPDRRPRLSLAWYDLWVGAFWDRRDRVLYVCPFPCVLLTFPVGPWPIP